MDKDNKNLLKYLGVVFIAVLLTYKLPHDSYSIVEYIIPPIRNNNSVIYLSGLVPLVLFVVGIKGLFKLERFKDKSKLLVFIAVIVILIPLMRWTLDFSRTNYHWIKDDGLKAIDIEDANISLSGSDSKTTVKVNMELKDYGRKQNKFKIRMYLPESLNLYTGKEFYEFENYHFTYGNRNITNIEEEIVLEFDSEKTEELFESKWYWENVEYELYNDDEAIKIIQHGL